MMVSKRYWSERIERIKARANKCPPSEGTDAALAAASTLDQLLADALAEPDLRLEQIRWCDCGRPWLPAQGLYGTTEQWRCSTCELQGAIEYMRRERDDARANARILAHSYEHDATPPRRCVDESLAYPVNPKRLLGET